MFVASQLGVDGANDMIISPVKVGTLSSRRKVRHIACGRKHYVMLTARPFGPLCHRIISATTKRLQNFETKLETKVADRYSVSAGKQCTLFTLQSVDSAGEICVSGGCVLKATINPTDIDYEIKARLQLAGSQFKPSESFSAEFDDNLDGTYNCVCKFLISGTFSMNVVLDELEVADSPFEVIVESNSRICPMKSLVWWGQYAVSSQSGSNIYLNA